MNMNLRTKHGKLTSYAMACGYRELNPKQGAVVSRLPGIRAYLVASYGGQATFPTLSAARRHAATVGR